MLCLWESFNSFNNNHLQFHLSNFTCFDITISCTLHSTPKSLNFGCLAWVDSIYLKYPLRFIRTFQACFGLFDQFYIILPLKSAHFEHCVAVCVPHAWLFKDDKNCDGRHCILTILHRFMASGTRFVYKCVAITSTLKVTFNM